MRKEHKNIINDEDGIDLTRKDIFYIKLVIIRVQHTPTDELKLDCIYYKSKNEIFCTAKLCLPIMDQMLIYKPKKISENELDNYKEILDEICLDHYLPNLCFKPQLSTLIFNSKDGTGENIIKQLYECPDLELRNIKKND